MFKRIFENKKLNFPIVSYTVLSIAVTVAVTVVEIDKYSHHENNQPKETLAVNFK